MLTKEEHSKLKEEGRTTIWFWGGKGFPITKCLINEYDERFPECYFANKEEIGG